MPLLNKPKLVSLEKAYVGERAVPAGVQRGPVSNAVPLDWAYVPSDSVFPLCVRNVFVETIPVIGPKNTPEKVLALSAQLPKDAVFIQPRRKL